MNLSASVLTLGYERPGTCAGKSAGVRPHPFRGGRLGRRLLLLFAIPWTAAACGHRVPMPTRPEWGSLPAGSPLRSHTLSERDAWLRHYVMFAEYPEAIGAFGEESPLAPGDRLLHALQEGVVLHEAGEYGRSNEVLEWAEIEAEMRYTRSLSREVAAILVSDRVLA